MTIGLPLNEVFARGLNELITTENLSYREFCSRINVQRKSLYGWLNGRYYPQFDALIKLADYFKVSINYLLGVSDELYTPTHCTINEVQGHFISKISDYMSENSLTKYAFAKKINVGQSTLKRWFEYGSIPDTAVLIKISKATGLSVDYLLGYN